MKGLALFLALALQEKGDNLPIPAKRPRPIFNGKPTDYPLSAIRKHEEGDVGFQILVDADGRPITCRVTMSSGYPDLDNQTCTDIKQMIDRFEPARDLNDLAIQSVYTSTIRWRLPNKP